MAESDSLKKWTRILIFLFLLTAGLIFAREFLIPFCLAILLAMLLYPLSSWLEKRGTPRIIAILLCLLLIIIVLAGLITLISSQVIAFTSDLPQLQAQIFRKLNIFQNFIEGKFGISSEAQMRWAKQNVNQSLEHSGAMIKSTLLGAASTFTFLALIPIYIFFFLFYREKYKKFIFRITPDDKMKRVNQVIENIQELVQSYLSGVLIVIAILAVLNSIALLIIGIPYAIVLGILAALLNIIPYVGVLIGSIIAATIAFLTKDSIWYTVAVIASMSFIQFLENNFITPGITGSKVSINPLTAIIALIIGGTIWGVPGMILFIPLAGILKAVFDSNEDLKPYGYLLGNEDTGNHSPSFSGIWQKIKNKFGITQKNEKEPDNEL